MSGSFSLNTCAQCKRPANFMCSCMQTYYCTKECQTVGWFDGKHKDICNFKNDVQTNCASTTSISTQTANQYSKSQLPIQATNDGNKVPTSDMKNASDNVGHTCGRTHTHSYKPIIPHVMESTPLLSPTSLSSANDPVAAIKHTVVLAVEKNPQRTSLTPPHSSTPRVDASEHTPMSPNILSRLSETAFISCAEMPKTEAILTDKVEVAQPSMTSLQDVTVERLSIVDTSHNSSTCASAPLTKAAAPQLPNQNIKTERIVVSDTQIAIPPKHPQPPLNAHVRISTENIDSALTGALGAKRDSLVPIAILTQELTTLPDGVSVIPNTQFTAVQSTNCTGKRVCMSNADEEIPKSKRNCLHEEPAVVLYCDWNICTKMFPGGFSSPTLFQEHLRDVHRTTTNRDNEEYTKLAYIPLDYQSSQMPLTEISGAGCLTRNGQSIYGINGGLTDIARKSVLMCTWLGCDDKFQRESDLNDHLRMHSEMEQESPTPEKLFVCTVTGCEERFPRQWDMTRHLRVHCGDKRYPCKYDGCTKSFNRADSRSRHYRIHTGARPYLCSWEGCSMDFNDSSARTKHMRMHTGEKPYGCTWEGCDKAYATTGQLTGHYRGHTNEKPFACISKDCSMRFSSRSSLVSHTETHVRNATNACGLRKDL